MTPHEYALVSGFGVRALQQAESLRRLGRTADALAKKMEKMSAEIVKATKDYDLTAEIDRNKALGCLETYRKAEAEGLIEVVVRHKRGDEVIIEANFWTGKPA